MKMKILLAALNVGLLIALGVVSFVNNRLETLLRRSILQSEQLSELARKHSDQTETTLEELRRCRIEAFRLSQCILTNAPQ